MKPFLTPHANVRRPQPAVRPPALQPTSARSTVLLSLLLAPRHDQSANGPRNR
jgi:hypothetical protein